MKLPASQKPKKMWAIARDGVGIYSWSLQETRKQSITAFEDETGCNWDEGKRNDCRCIRVSVAVTAGWD